MWNTLQHIGPTAHPPLSIPPPPPPQPSPSPSHPSHRPPTPHTQHETHHTHHTYITGTRVDTKRRRHRRLLCDYSALRFTVYFGSPKVHTSQHIGPNTHPSVSMPPTPSPPHPSHRPTRTTHNTRHTTHHTHITGTRVDTMRRRHQRLFRDYSAHRFRRVFHHTHTTRHTTHHTHTHITGTWVDTR